MKKRLQKEGHGREVAQTQQPAGDIIKLPGVDVAGQGRPEKRPVQLQRFSGQRASWCFRVSDNDGFISPILPLLFPILFSREKDVLFLNREWQNQLHGCK